MASAARVGPVALIAAAGLVTAVAGGRGAYRIRSAIASMSLLRQAWAIVTVVFILANIKNLPFVWHVRTSHIFNMCPFLLQKSC